MSPDLIAFLKAWYDWATNGAPDGRPFRRRNGLCYNAYIWFEKISKPITNELVVSLGSDFPFGESNYSQRWHARTQHECPERLAWVRERLIEAGELSASHPLQITGEQ